MSYIKHTMTIYEKKPQDKQTLGIPLIPPKKRL